MANNKIIIYDGICNLCNSTMTIVQKHLIRKGYRFVPNHSNEGNELIQKFNLIDVVQDSVVILENNIIITRSAAIQNIISKLPFPWNLFNIFKFIPPRLSDRVYNFIAKNRYFIFGKTKL